MTGKSSKTHFGLCLIVGRIDIRCFGGHHFRAHDDFDGARRYSCLLPIPLRYGRDKLISPRLEEMNSKYETPHWAILITGLVMGMAILLLPLKDVVKLTSGFKIMIFIMINSCVIILRQTSKTHEWDPAYHAVHSTLTCNCGASLQDVS